MSCRTRAKNFIRMQILIGMVPRYNVKSDEYTTIHRAAERLKKEIGKISIFSVLAFSCFLLLIRSYKYRRGEATENSTVLDWKWRVWCKLMALCLSKHIQDDTGIETNVHTYTS